MKSICLRLLCLLFAAAFCLQGCTYHGKIRHDIYKPARDFEEKINARVLVVSDKFFPVAVSTDYTGKYNFRLSDGLPTAVADALRTLFTEVDVDTYNHRMNYDYVVEVEYAAALDVNHFRMEVFDEIYPTLYWHPMLYTQITLTVRNPKTGYAVARFSETAKAFMPLPSTDVALGIINVFKYLTLGLLSPLQVQVYGSKMRSMIEKSIVYTLRRKIMPQMSEDRLNFTQNHPTESTNTRLDGKFIPFMQATLFIQTDSGLGSGFLISPDGYIITNAHVVGNNRDVGVILYDNRHVMDKTDPTLSPSRRSTRNKVLFGKVLKRNRTRDLALVKIEGKNYPWLQMEPNRTAYATGTQVVAIGAPRSFEWSVAQGVISATRDNNGVDTIQTDTAINGGNSGGPLIDLKTGKVLGVNSWMQISDADLISLRRGTEGLNFAISAFEVARTLGVSQPVDPDDFLHPEDEF